MGFKHIPFGTKEEFNVVVEIPKDSPNKYEYDEKLDNLVLDWVFTDGFVFPFNYGFIPQTLGGDGDTLDVFVLGENPLNPGVIVKCKAVGLIEFIDRGERDDKVIAVPLADKTLSAYKGLADIPFDFKKVFEDFFTELARQKNKDVEIRAFHDAERATEMIGASFQK